MPETGKDSAMDVNKQEAVSAMSPAPAGVDRRSSLRTFLISSRLIVVKLGPDNGGIILDASEGGLRVQAVGPVPTDTCCTIEIDSADLAPLSATAVVAWSSDSNVAGLRFVDLTPFAQRRIAACLLGTTCFGQSPQTLSRTSDVHEAALPSHDKSRSETPASRSTSWYQWLLGRRWLALASGLSGLLVMCVCLWVTRRPVTHVTTEKTVDTATAPLRAPQPEPDRGPASTIEPNPAAVLANSFRTQPAPARQQLRNKRVGQHHATDVHPEPEVVIRVFRNGQWEQMPALHH